MKSHIASLCFMLVCSGCGSSGPNPTTVSPTPRPPPDVVNMTEEKAAQLPAQFEKLDARTAPFIVDLTWSEVSGDVLKELRRLELLRGVNLFGTDATDAELAHLAGLPHLESIDLGGCEVTSEGILQLHAARHLKRLGLASVRPPLDDKAIARIVAAFPNLESLSLDKARLTDAGLIHIGKLRRLNYLNISQTEITSDGLESLTGLSELETLHAQNTNINDTGLRHVAQLERLKKLDLNFTGISDAGLAELRPLTNLKRIYFVGTKVTDAGLKHLEPLKMLEYIGPNWENTPAALQELKEALPRYKSNQPG